MKSSIFRTGLFNFRLVLSLLTVFLLAPATYAQFDTATVLGTVTDSTGAAVPKATVTLKNTATGITVSAQTETQILPLFMWLCFFDPSPS